MSPERRTLKARWTLGASHADPLIAKGIEYLLTNYVQTSDMRLTRRPACCVRSGGIGIDRPGNRALPLRSAEPALPGSDRDGGPEWLGFKAQNGADGLRRETMT